MFLRVMLIIFLSFTFVSGMASPFQLSSIDNAPNLHEESDLVVELLPIAIHQVVRPTAMHSIADRIGRMSNLKKTLAIMGFPKRGVSLLTDRENVTLDKLYRGRIRKFRNMNRISRPQGHPLRWG